MGIGVGLSIRGGCALDGIEVLALYTGKRAIDTALAIRAELAKMDPITMGDRQFKAEVSVGINSGEMVSGNIGSASLKRLDYTVIGDSVNVAQRLQSVAKASQILITEQVHNQIKESFKSEKVGEFTLKNKEKPVMTYEVIE